MKSYIDKNSLINFDDWKGYNQTNRIFREHLTVNSIMGFLIMKIIVPSIQLKEISMQLNLK
ncbi:hypothetical protein H311_00857 [Anncaliia algerae PRA109]|nr:hypothetical protein H311_00857 [Anncaliia algerae PRA109]